VQHPLGKWYYAEYSTFTVQPESTNYKLQVSGYSGNAADLLRRQNGMMFSTYDRDNDEHESYHCAEGFGGGYWFMRCGRCLNCDLLQWEIPREWGNEVSSLRLSRMWLECK